MKIDHLEECREIAGMLLYDLEQKGRRYSRSVVYKAGKAAAKYHQAGDMFGVKEAIKQAFRECEIKRGWDGSIA